MIIAWTKSLKDIWFNISSSENEVPDGRVGIIRRAVPDVRFESLRNWYNITVHFWGTEIKEPNMGRFESIRVFFNTYSKTDDSRLEVEYGLPKEEFKKLHS